MPDSCCLGAEEQKDKADMVPALRELTLGGREAEDRLDKQIWRPRTHITVIVTHALPQHSRPREDECSGCTRAGRPRGDSGMISPEPCGRVSMAGRHAAAETKCGGSRGGKVGRPSQEQRVCRGALGVRRAERRDEGVGEVGGTRQGRRDQTWDLPPRVRTPDGRLGQTGSVDTVPGKGRQ